MEWQFFIVLAVPIFTFKDHICSESIRRSSDSLWDEEGPSFFLFQNFGENITNSNKGEFPMNEHAKYEEEITIMKVLSHTNQHIFSVFARLRADSGNPN